jgi:uncharacterized protein YjbI with pentapeptide repeats
METDAVRHIKDPLYETLRKEDITAFNAEKSARGDLPSFAHGDFRGLDLRGMNAHGLDLSHAYFRGSDIRGIDFSQSNMEGASIAQANDRQASEPVATGMRQAGVAGRPVY